ncbi:MAG: PucR family transcriptional regulator ligand-binding domain-containing protein [Roseburia sp.]|nr:PucR family transcriptional regulator ligand-binding domain-containing protein [Roseburia sp.]
MGFTIQDMLILSKDRYQMELIAGQNGWSNSISWALMLEDIATINHFTGKELVVTTGLGFNTDEKWLRLAKRLTDNHASGLIINMGGYLYEVPESLKKFCDENDLPLMTVPWEVVMVDMIKDLSIRLFLQGTADEQITAALIRAIEEPENQELYKKDLLPYFDVDGMFQVVLITTEGLDEMDTVERKKLSYRLQIYLENITHNGSFFYYDGNFVVVMNDVSQKDFDEIINGMVYRTERRMPEIPIYVGTGSKVNDILNLNLSYRRAKAAADRAKSKKMQLLHFDEMGMFRLLHSVNDTALLAEMSDGPLQPLIEYDKKHSSNYLETLELYLKHNGSIQAVAEAMYTHRNTVIYRISNIKKLLNSELDTTEERLMYQMAFYIRNM